MMTDAMQYGMFQPTEQVQTVTVGRNPVDTVTVRLAGPAPETLSIGGLTYMVDATGCFTILRAHAIELSKSRDFRLASGERFVPPSPEQYIELATGESQLRVNGLVIWNGMKCLIRRLEAEFMGARATPVAFGVAESLYDRPRNYYQPAMKFEVKFDATTYQVIEARQVSVDNPGFDAAEVQEARRLRERVATGRDARESVRGTKPPQEVYDAIIARYRGMQTQEIMAALRVTDADLGLVPVTTATPMRPKPPAAERRAMRLDEEIP